MIDINMIGGGFQHDVCSSALNKNEHINWVKNRSANISIHIDNGLTMKVDPTKENYGWLAESSSIIPHHIKFVLNNLEVFKRDYKYIFTHDRRIIEKDPEFFKFAIPNGKPWVQNREIYPKTKDTSFVVSNKSMTSGQKYRLGVLSKVLPSGKVDHFGRGSAKELPWSSMVNGIEESGKLSALKDYRFSFVFENDNYPSIFCEKLTDCFATGTIPIFWGTPDIGEFFDKDGIIVYDDDFDINTLTEELYESKMEHIKNNFNLANELLSSEDYIYINHIS
jgi:hypothetical protein